MSARSLEDRVAVITGGAKGIGLAITRRLLSDGARVSVWDLEPGAMPDDVASDERVSSRRVDVASMSEVGPACEEVLRRAGRIDILVNNAGLAGSTVPLDAYDPDEWRRIVDVNLLGVFYCCRAVVPHMRAAGRGRIVNVASLAGKEGTANASAYSAAKAAVIALTKSLGKELATSGVLANTVAPAAIDTEILAQMSPDHVATMIAKSPMGRLGTADEAADLVAWLCSDACSFSTGAVFDLSGGRATY